MGLKYNEIISEERKWKFISWPGKAQSIHNVAVVGRSKRALSRKTFVRNTRQSYFIVETDRLKLQGGRCARWFYAIFLYSFSLCVKKYYGNRNEATTRRWFMRRLMRGYRDSGKIKILINIFKSTKLEFTSA